MNWVERREKLAALPERDKRILQLARSVSNNLLFSKQNAGRNAEIRYEEKADQAMTELENLLLSP